MRALREICGDFVRQNPGQEQPFVANDIVKSLLFLLTILWTTFPIFGQATGVAPMKRIDVELLFANGSPALSEDQRLKFEATVSQVRLADWCPLKGVSVEGFAAEGEVAGMPRKELARQRASYIAGLLQRHGVPEYRIWERPASEADYVRLPSSSLVRVMFAGGWDDPKGCNVPLDLADSESRFLNDSRGDGCFRARRMSPSGP